MQPRRTRAGFAVDAYTDLGTRRAVEADVNGPRASRMWTLTTVRRAKAAEALVADGLLLAVFARPEPLAHLARPANGVKARGRFEPAVAIASARHALDPFEDAALALALAATHRPLEQRLLVGAQRGADAATPRALVHAAPRRAARVGRRLG